MGSGDIIAGSNPSTRKSKTTTVVVRNLAKGAGPSARRTDTAPPGPEGHCGAMSQQRADSGTTMSPQKFLHLVGCHDPKARDPKPRRPDG